MNIFQDIKAFVNVYDVVERYGIKTIHSGKNQFCLCPFHNDKNPSMVLYGNRYLCYGCGAAGDVIDFVSKIEHITQFAAAKKIDNDFALNLFIQHQKKQINLSGIYKEDAELMNGFCIWEDMTYDNICTFYRIIARILQYMDINDDRYATYIFYRDYFDYILDMLLTGSTADKVEVYQQIGWRWSN